MRLLLFLIAVLIPCFLKAQNQNTVQWAWTNNYSNQNNSIASEIIVDENNDIFVAGYYRDTLDIDTITLYGPSNNDDPFIAKFNANGEVQWAKRVEWGNYVNDLLIDEQGNIRLLVSQTYMITLNSFNGQLEDLTYIPYTSGGGGTEFAEYFGLGPNNHLYIVYQSGLGVSPSSVQVRYFNLAGSAIVDTVWERSFETGISSIPFGGYLAGFDVDSTGNLYLAGTTEFSTDLSLVGDSIVSFPDTNYTEGLYITKFDTLGAVNWLDTMSGNSLNIADMETNLIDSSLYITGSFRFNERIHGDTLFGDSVNSFQMYVAKYDIDGSYQWVKPYSLVSPSVNVANNNDALYSTELAVTDSGYVYVKGLFTGSVTWNTDTLYEDTSVYYPNYVADDVFFTKLDSLGNPIWGKYAGNNGGSGKETGDFWVDQEFGTLYLVGFNIDSNNINKQSYSNPPTRGIFIAKEVGGPISTVSLPELENLNSGVFVYPNPARSSITIQKNNSNADILYSLVNLNGQEIIAGKLTKEKEALNLSTLNPGVYFLKTSLGAVKIVKQ